jgi:hypothetical protein
LETILNEVDRQLQATFKNKGLKAYGFCELVDKDGKPNPVTCSNGINKSRTPAQIHDSHKGIFYHRLLANTPVTEDEEFSFGTLKLRFQPRIRTVIAFKQSLGEEFIFEFIDAIPDKITTLTGYKFVLLTQGTLIADHDAVFNQEYGQNSYEKHRITWNIYALEYDIDFMLC